MQLNDHMRNKSTTTTTTAPKNVAFCFPHFMIEKAFVPCLDSAVSNSSSSSFSSFLRFYFCCCIKYFNNNNNKTYLNQLDSFGDFLKKPLNLLLLLLLFWTRTQQNNNTCKHNTTTHNHAISIVYFIIELHSAFQLFDFVLYFVDVD